MESARTVDYVHMLICVGKARGLPRGVPYSHKNVAALLYLVSWCGNKAKKCILPSLGDKRCNMGLNNVSVVM